MFEINELFLTLGDRPLFQDFSLRVEPGEVVAVMGVNGSGKSTLFSCITGRRRPDRGEILLQEKSTLAMSERQIAAIIAELQQDPKVGSVAEMTVWENLCLASLRGRPARLCSQERGLSLDALHALFAELGVDISPLFSRMMGQLSGGQRQLVNFVMAVLRPPALLLLDEPTAALDSQAADQLLSAVDSYVRRHQIACLMITHSREDGEQFANRLVLL